MMAGNWHETAPKAKENLHSTLALEIAISLSFSVAVFEPTGRENNKHSWKEHGRQTEGDKTRGKKTSQM